MEDVKLAGSSSWKVLMGHCWLLASKLKNNGSRLAGVARIIFSARLTAASLPSATGLRRFVQEVTVNHQGPGPLVKMPPGLEFARSSIATCWFGETDQQIRPRLPGWLT